VILSDPVVLEPLPWLDDPWQSLLTAIRADRLGHALLLTGPAGIGKRRLADLLAAALLCERPEPTTGLPCGQCADCRLLAAGNHPDLTRLVPDPESKTHEIKADAVRELCTSQALTTSRGRRAVFRIAPAEAMNRVAANGLLKTLEEPSASTLMLLVSEAPGGLLATIRSRCQRVSLALPPAAQALPWLRARVPPGLDAERLLAVAHGAPLRALALASAELLAAREGCLQGLSEVAAGAADPVGVAQAWQAQDPALVLDWLAGWISDALRLALDADVKHLTNPDHRERLIAIAARVPPQSGHRYLQQVYAARAEAASTVNKQLLFEALLLRWAALTANRPQPARTRPAN
jgi:DNA polymerase III subunit delta'